jgi:hypothetical protein
MWTYRYVGLRLHTEIPLVALLGLVHLWVPFSGFVFGGTGSRDQGGINDRALLHCHPPLLEVGLDRFKNLLAEVVLLKQMPECQDRCLIRVPAKRRMVATSISASSMAGSLRLYH